MEEKRVYFISGHRTTTCKEFDTLEEAVKACIKYNKKVKNPRRVMSGIPVGNSRYTDDKIEWKPL